MARPRQVSDELILATMRRRALAHGPGVSLDLVAEELDVSTPALLKRFGSRQSLMIAALRPPEMPEWIRKLDEGPSDRPLEAQLRRILTEALAFMGEVVPCMVVLRESGIPIEAIFPKKKPPELVLEGLRSWLARAHKIGLVTADETETAAYAITGGIQSRVMYTHITKRKFSPSAQARYVAELARLFTRALTP